MIHIGSVARNSFSVRVKYQWQSHAVRGLFAVGQFAVRKMLVWVRLSCTELYHIWLGRVPIQYF